jgi:hypothetical protein
MQTSQALMPSTSGPRCCRVISAVGSVARIPCARSRRAACWTTARSVLDAEMSMSGRDTGGRGEVSGARSACVARSAASSDGAAVGAGARGSHCVQTTQLAPPTTASATGEAQRRSATGGLAGTPCAVRGRGGVSARASASAGSAAAANGSVRSRCSWPRSAPEDGVQGGLQVGRGAGREGVATRRPAMRFIRRRSGATESRCRTPISSVTVIVASGLPTVTTWTGRCRPPAARAASTGSGPVVLVPSVSSSTSIASSRTPGRVVAPAATEGRPMAATAPAIARQAHSPARHRRQPPPHHTMRNGTSLVEGRSSQARTNRLEG